MTIPFTFGRRSPCPRMAARSVPEGYPRFGTLLESGGRPVGVLLMIVST
jgi:hypothetical protein